MLHTTHKPSLLIKVLILAGGFAFAWGLPAQTPSWFPLEVGNTWLYRPVRNSNSRPGNADFRAIRVHGTETMNGRSYFNVDYFGREVVLREDSSAGSVVVYDRASGAEQPWLALGLPVGSSFQAGINPCPTNGQITANDASVPTPAGRFTNAIQVTFRGSCVDVGATQQFFVPGVGLVRDEETTFAGPLLYELVYYRAGSNSAAAPEVSFTVATDASRYSTGGTLEARLTLRSTSTDPIVLHYPSGQSFDFKILNGEGALVYQWSSGRAFTMIVRDETFGPGEQTYGLSASLDGLPPGRYTALGYLTTNPLLYSAQVSFEIASAPAAGSHTIRIAGRR